MKMMQFNLSSSHLLFLSSAILAILLHSSPAYADPLFSFCDNTANYTRNSTFDTNLKTLLTSLSNASRLNNFYNTSIGGDLDRLYGVALCRGDATPDVCRSCIDTAATEILQLCNNRSAAIYYDNCLLRYSNQNILGSTDNSQRFYMWNIESASNVDRFNQVVADLMRRLAANAALQPWRRKFATGEANLTSFRRIYGLVQCIPEMSSNDCYKCLDGVISSVDGSQCSGKIGCRFVGPVCNMRYEQYSFYQRSAIAAPAPAPPPVPTPPPSDDGPSPVNGTSTSTGNENSSRLVAILVPAIGIPVILGAIVTFLLLRKTRLKKKKIVITTNDGPDDSDESFHVDLDSIRIATNNFSDDNKLGEGGFGPVYMGMLSDGQEIAVKRLSINSGQGVEEFRNEVALVAKLQHRNLVRLFGCCVAGEEKLLIYEYVPNRSLDNFLFDPSKRAILHWERRYKIIGGIARGLLYLHEDSRLRIIHRDLKASNVLLDADMHAKISDFGMAKIVRVDQTQGNTSRIAGTFGYMSPEYAMRGQFSVKSDVFSFGVLILEILTGQKNTSFYKSELGEDLLSYAWKAWNDGTVLELIDASIRHQCSTNEAIRCVHIGLLCVQEDPTARPSMSSIVLMLNSFSMTLPAPTTPAFFIGNSKMDPNFPALDNSSQASHLSSPRRHSAVSRNDVSITELEPR